MNSSLTRPRTPRVELLTKTLRVNEVFFSLQGESTQAGRPSAFVRLTGCPLRCTYCDTAYAFYEGSTRTFQSLFDELEKFPTRLVELTGGEPLAQPNAPLFLEELVARGYETMIETSGAFPIQALPRETRIILDIKTPGSGESHRQLWDNLGDLKDGTDEIKFVVTSRADFDFACDVTRDRKLTDRFTTLVSPSFGQVAPRDLAAWVLESGVPFRFQTQLHKALWGEARGV